MARVLVTGASGFIGGALYRELARLGCEVWVVARQPMTLLDAARMVTADLSQPSTAAELRRRLPRGAFEAVFHLAAMTPRHGGEGLGDLLTINALGTERLIQALTGPPARLAYFSTVDVYGPRRGAAVLNEETAVAPLTPYAISKYAGERIALVAASRSSVPLTIFRLAQVYGPADPTAKAIPSFCAAVAAGRRPVVRGLGAEVRQPIHVSDVVSAAVRWLEQPPGSTSETLLLAGAEQVTIVQLAQLAMDVGGMRGAPIQEGSSAASGLDYRLDARRTEAELGWSPRVSLRDGMSDLLDRPGGRGVG
jgi:nucleoside-diphosphate-sugar epimerase